MTNYIPRSIELTQIEDLIRIQQHEKRGEILNLKKNEETALL